MMELISTHLQAEAVSEKPVVATDMEGTLSGGVTWQGFRTYLREHGRAREIDRVIRGNMWKYPIAKLGLIDIQTFKENWLLRIFRLFEGMSREEFNDVCRWVVENELWPKRRTAVIDELTFHLAAGRRVIAVSGLIEPALAIFTEKIGIEAIGTPLAYDRQDRFTGRVAGRFTTGPNKVAQLNYFQDPAGRIHTAYGDTYADIPMLSMAENPVAVAPDSGLREAANRQGWRILAE